MSPCKKSTRIHTTAVPRKKAHYRWKGSLLFSFQVFRLPHSFPRFLISNNLIVTFLVTSYKVLCDVAPIYFFLPFLLAHSFLLSPSHARMCVHSSHIQLFHLKATRVSFWDTQNAPCKRFPVLIPGTLRMSPYMANGTLQM